MITVHIWTDKRERLTINHEISFHVTEPRVSNTRTCSLAGLLEAFTH